MKYLYTFFVFRSICICRDVTLIVHWVVKISIICQAYLYLEFGSPLSLTLYHKTNKQKKAMRLGSARLQYGKHIVDAGITFKSSIRKKRVFFRRICSQNQLVPGPRLLSLSLHKHALPVYSPPPRWQPKPNITRHSKAFKINIYCIQIKMKANIIKKKKIAVSDKQTPEASLSETRQA